MAVVRRAPRRLLKPCQHCSRAIRAGQKYVSTSGNRSKGRNLFHLKHYVDAKNLPMIPVTAKVGSTW